MFDFVKKYLSFRTASIKLGSYVSPPCRVQRGVPQGGVLSPLLFNLIMKDLPSYLQSNVQFSIYADDVAIWISGTDPRGAVEILQTAVNGVYDFARDSA